MGAGAKVMGAVVVAVAVLVGGRGAGDWWLVGSLGATFVLLVPWITDGPPWRIDALRLAAIPLAVALGAFMSLGDLQTLHGDANTGVDAFVPISIAGIVALVGLIGFHAMWLMALAAQLFAASYERWFWNDDPHIGGMDGIGYYPTSVFIGMFFAVPMAGLLALLRRELLRRWGLRNASA